MSSAESSKEAVSDIHELGLSEPLLRAVLTVSSNVQHWSVERVTELVTDVLRDVGADAATVFALRLGFARDAIDGWALTD